MTLISRSDQQYQDWIQHGHIEARQCRPGMPYALTITDEIDMKLRTTTSSHLSVKSPILVE